MLRLPGRPVLSEETVHYSTAGREQQPDGWVLVDVVASSVQCWDCVALLSVDQQIFRSSRPTLVMRLFRLLVNRQSETHPTRGTRIPIRVGDTRVSCPTHRASQCANLAGNVLDRFCFKSGIAPSYWLPHI